MSFRAPVVTTTSVILSSNKIQNVDILVRANAGPPGKWPLKHIEQCVCVFVNIYLIISCIRAVVHTA